jgi:transposase
MSESRKSYPSAVSDAEWELLVPYPALMREDAPQRDPPLRELFNALRWVVKTGAQWRHLPNDFPPWEAVYQPARRRARAGAFQALAHDLRMMARMVAEREAQPTAAVLGGRALPSTPEGGGCGGYDGYKRRKGSKVHIALDTLGNLLALAVTPANGPERAQVAELAAAVQGATGGTVELAFADQGYTGDDPAEAAHAHGIRLVVVQPDEAKRGFVLLPRRWVVERTFGWLGRFRRPARDYERLAQT